MEWELSRVCRLDGSTVGQYNIRSERSSTQIGEDGLVVGAEVVTGCATVGFG